MLAEEDFHCIMLSVFVILIFVSSTFARTENFTYNSRREKEGMILSPDYPYSYKVERTIDYFFKGQPNEKVQIIFDNFQLYQKDSNQRCGNDNSYINYKRERKENSVNLCGMSKPLPIISESNNFEMRYKQIITPPDAIGTDQKFGFNATYRFVTNYGIDSGEQKEGVCEFTYSSTVATNGTFSSPNYNGLYPNSIECLYFFIGQETYIKLNFNTFNLLGTDDCTDINRRDYIEVSNVIDKDPSLYYQVFCGYKNKSFEIVINDTFLFVSYHRRLTNSTESELLQSYPYIGFLATFEFTNDTEPNSSERKLAGSLIICFCVCMNFKIGNLLF